MKGENDLDQTFAKFIEQGQLSISNMVLHRYSQLGLTNEEFILFLQISSCLQAGQDFPDLESIAQRMGVKNTEIYDLLHQLLAKKLLTIAPVSDANGKKHDCYSFELLYRKLTTLEENDEKKEADQDSLMEKEQVYNSIEEEFGHPLSPIEMETIDSWLKEDHYSPELISAALREAVLARVYNLKYMDKILLNWEKQNVRSAADVANLQTKRRQKYSGQSGETKKQGNNNKPHIPLYRWSDKPDSK